MTVDADWVRIAPVIDPVKDHLRAASNVPTTFGRAPRGTGQAGPTPPFNVLLLLGDPRLIESLDGNQPVTITWQVDSFGETPLQAVAIGDKVAKAMLHDPPPDLPGATVVMREGTPDARPDMPSEGRYVRQQRFRWTLVAAST